MVHNLSQVPSLAGGFVSDTIGHVCYIFTFIDMAPIFDHLHPDLCSFPIFLISHKGSHKVKPEYASHKGSHKVKPEYALKTKYYSVQFGTLLGVTYVMVRKL